LASALRRSELVALQVSDILRDQPGLRVTIRRSKTDQEGRGAVIAIPEGRRLRPVARLLDWLDCAAIAEGPLFRRISNDGKVVTSEPMSDRSVARVVQARVAAAGLDPTKFAGHSLRAGFLTSAARSGASVFKMREVSRHKTLQVLADYVRDARIFDDHAGEGFL
jgi:integrase